MLLSLYPSQRYGGWARELARISDWPAPSPFGLTRGPVATFWWLGRLSSVPVCQTSYPCWDEGEGRSDETLFRAFSGCHKASLPLKEEQSYEACKRFFAFPSAPCGGWTRELAYASKWSTPSRLRLACGLGSTFRWFREEGEVDDKAVDSVGVSELRDRLPSVPGVGCHSGVPPILHAPVPRFELTTANELDLPVNAPLEIGIERFACQPILRLPLSLDFLVKRCWPS